MDMHKRFAFVPLAAMFLAAAPQTANDFYQAGKAAQKAGDFATAEADYAQAKKQGFPNAYVAYRLATLRLARHDPAGAVAALDTAAGLGGIPPESLEGDAALAPLAKDPGFLAYLDGQKRAYHPCRYDAVYRALDFWVGDWNVTNAQGAQAGTSHVERLIDDCAIYENWTGAYGDTGKSFTSYDRNTKRWDQHWIASTGGVVEYVGDAKDGTVVMIASAAAGMTRLTFSRLAGGKVRQLFENSTDGKTWTIGADYTYAPFAPK